jgi:glyoxylase-like metal-dependent hydrolase (beta-lactamase superfamily II)
VFVRRQNRKLFKGARSHLRNTLPSAKGFKRGDRVQLADGQAGFIFGLRSTGYFDVRKLDGTVLHHSASYKTVRRLEGARTLSLESSVISQQEPEAQCRAAIAGGAETVPAASIVSEVPLEQWNQALLEYGYSTADSLVDFNCLYIETRLSRILVDAGWGHGTQRRDGALLGRLQAEGLTPADIDCLIITHGDGDHVGGILNADNQPVFHNATYLLLREAWDFWTSEDILAKLPEYLTGFGRHTLPLIRSRIKVVESGDEFLPGFQLLAAPGHRPGHAALAVTSAGEHLLHMADAVGHPILMEHPAWHWAFDTQPDQAEKDKRQLLDWAVSRQTLVFGAHLPFPGVGRATPQGEGWRWEAQTSSS